MTYKVKLEIFEGPLDLLLHLIKEEELNIYDIPITRITEQYLEHLNLMEILDLEIAGEFLVVAATLMQIKSRLLLPPDPEGAQDQEPDPRAELVRRLLEYKAFKEAAGRMRVLEEARGMVFTRAGAEVPAAGDSPLVDISIFDLVSAFAKVLKGLPKSTSHEIVPDEFTVAEKTRDILERLAAGPVYFREFFRAGQNKMELITTFLALLELMRLREVTARQDGHFEDIEIVRRAA